MTRLAFDRPLRAVRKAEAPSELATVAAERTLDPIGLVRSAEADAHRRMTALAASIGEAASGVQRLVGERLDEWAGWIVETALSLAGEVVGRHVRSGGYDPTPAVRECLEQAVGSGATPIVVRVAVDDFDRVVGAIEANGCKFEIDTSLSAGCCRVETPVGRFEHDPYEVLNGLVERVRQEFAQ